jgi:hypothetical protein
MECVLLKKFMPTYIHSEIDGWFKKSTPVITHKEAKYSSESMGNGYKNGITFGP